MFQIQVPELSNTVQQDLKSHILGFCHLIQTVLALHLSNTGNNTSFFFSHILKTSLKQKSSHLTDDCGAWQCTCLILVEIALHTPVKVL